MAQHLQDKIGIVTGGESGIGRGTALAMAREGATLVLAGLDQTKGEEVVHEIATEGGRALFLRADVRLPEDCAAIVDLARREFGRLDIAFNNAGGQGGFGRIHELDLEEANYWTDTNLKGVLYCLRYETPLMLASGGGAIVNTSSIFGRKGVAALSYYVAAKHGITGLTRAAALDFARDNIRVNAVCPGPIKTPSLDRASGGDDALYAGFVPMHRIGQPAEIAAAVVWLLSDEASYVTGAVLSVDGGMAVA